jgi:hypothetical protein
VNSGGETKRVPPIKDGTLRAIMLGISFEGSANGGAVAGRPEVSRRVQPERRAAGLGMQVCLDFCENNAIVLYNE